MQWKNTWKYLPVNYNTTIAYLENTTQTSIFKNNLAGKKLRLLFSNRYAKEDLVLEKVSVRKQDTSENLSSPLPITCKGLEKILIPAGEEFYSDEIPFDIAPGENIVLSLYFKEKVPVQSAVSVWSSFACQSFYKKDCSDICHDMPGEDWAASHRIFPYADADIHKPTIVTGICAIGLYTEDYVKTLALFGDSITHMSYFSDPLLELFMQKEAGRSCIENYGIGGNRILRDAGYFPAMEGEGACFGPSGISRFENDIFKEEKPDAVMLLEGINDIMHPYFFNHQEEVVRALDLQKALTELISISHKHDSPIFLGTVMPFFQKQLPKQDWYAHAETIRQACNLWIRQYAPADGILDYDLAIRDEKFPACMQEDTHLGDWLHPNEKGGSIMADIAYKAWKEKQA